MARGRVPSGAASGVSGLRAQHSDLLLSINPGAPLSLQRQIRRQIVAAISAGSLPSGRRLPSSRSLARELGIARNTVSLAYQELVAEGHLRASERSGVFVSDMVRRTSLDTSHIIGSREAVLEVPDLVDRIAGRAILPARFRPPPDWQRYPYSFLDGRFDKSLFPVTHWREATRLALSASEVADWSSDAGEIDDELLVQQIRTQVLTRRGILASRNEILVLGSEQQALHLLSFLMLQRGASVAVEEPGLPETRALLTLVDAQIHLQPVDDEGMIIDGRLENVAMVHVTASRQRPTGVTLSAPRRTALLELARQQKFWVIEDDFDHEWTFLGRPLPAMRGMEGGERVIYVASLARALAPGVRLSFMCGPAELIGAARQLRDLATHRPSPLNQRAAAHFLELGHYEAMNSRLIRVVQERLLALRDALNHYLPNSVAVPLRASVAMAPVEGGSAIWVRGPETLDARLLAFELEKRGVLIEPTADYFAGDIRPRNMFRMGVTSIPVEKIRAGVETIAAVVREMTTGSGDDPALALPGADIARRLAGATLLYRTVYGEPCTIEIRDDGTLSGRAGFANEDIDHGRWWIEGDKWVRQWTSWAYGERAAFGVTIEGNQLSWLNEMGTRIDSAVLARFRS